MRTIVRSYARSKPPTVMSSASQVVDRYLTLVNEHDIEGALSCLAETFELRFGDSEYVVTKGAMANAMGWDAGAKGHLEYTVVKSDGHDVVIEGHESNEFLSLIGIVGLSFRSKFEVGDEDLIERQVHHVDWGNITMEVAMKPLIDWAADEQPDELERIYPNGRMVYTKSAAEQWIDLAKKWRAAHR